MPLWWSVGPQVDLLLVINPDTNELFPDHALVETNSTPANVSEQLRGELPLLHDTFVLGGAQPGVTEKNKQKPESQFQSPTLGGEYTVSINSISQTTDIMETSNGRAEQAEVCIMEEHLEGSTPSYMLICQALMSTSSQELSIAAAPHYSLPSSSLSCLSTSHQAATNMHRSKYILHPQFQANHK